MKLAKALRGEELDEEREIPRYEAPHSPIGGRTTCLADSTDNSCSSCETWRTTKHEQEQSQQEDFGPKTGITQCHAGKSNHRKAPLDLREPGETLYLLNNEHDPSLNTSKDTCSSDATATITLPIEEANQR